MVYYADDMALDEVRIVYSGEKNDVLVCQDIHSPIPVYYTLIVIKDRQCAKQMLTIYEGTAKSCNKDETPYLKCFGQNEQLCFLYHYRQERHIHSFLEGQMLTPFDREQAAIHLTMEALSTPHPYPLLALLFRTGEVHIQKDNSIFFSPYFQLALLNDADAEESCTELCANMILEILQGGKKKLKSMQLIQKKVNRHAYHGLHELYRDIRLTALPQKKSSILKRIQTWFLEHKDGLFRVLLVCCIIVVVIAVVMIICQLLLGDIPFLKLFEHSFDVIGTQRLR